MLRIINTGASSAKDNMSLDEKLLENLDPKEDPILHLYQWSRPSATFGYFIDPQMHLNLRKVGEYGVDLARRPTGGGIVFHIWDLAFSFLMPSSHRAFFLNPLQNYEFVNQIVLEVVRDYFSLTPELTEKDLPERAASCRHFCMAKPTQYDVIYGGMKIAGAAQRRRRQGYLHQGTISLMKPRFEMLEELLRSKDVLAAMTSYTFAPISDAKVLQKGRGEIEKLLADKLRAALTS